MTDLLVNHKSGAPETETQKFRSQMGHISRQSGVFFAGTVFTAGLGYIFKIYLARVLGPEDLGLFALGVTLIGFVGMFNTLGLPDSAVRFVAKYQAAGRMKELHALLWRGGSLLLCANLIFGVLLLTAGRLVALHFYHAPRLTRYLPFFAVMMLLNVLSLFYGKVLVGYRDVRLRTLIVNFVGSPLQMLVAVLLISLGFGLRGYLLAQIVTAVVALFLLLRAVRKLTPQAARLSASGNGYPEKEVWYFSASVLGVNIAEFAMMQSDRIALGVFRSVREVGIYSIASALVVYVPLVLSSINQIFSPTIADLHTRGEHELLGRLFQSLTKWTIALTLPLAVVIMLLARPFMRIFGPAFEPGWPILVIGTMGQLVNCGVGSVGHLLLMSGNQNRLMKVQVVMAVLTVALSLMLVPLWGITGAAIASAASNVGMNAWNLFEVRKALGLSPYNRGYLRLLIPSLALVATELELRAHFNLFRHDWLAIGCALVLGYAVFEGILFLTGLDADDRLVVLAIWSRVRSGFSWIRSEAEV